MFYQSGVNDNMDYNNQINLYDYRPNQGAMSTASSPYSQSSMDSSESSQMSSSPAMSPDSYQNHMLILSADDLLLQNIAALSTSHATHLGPYLEILEQPVDKFRFRYRSEMLGAHGSILGKTSLSPKHRNKTYPKVKLCNYSGTAIIRCSLFTADPNESARSPHTHRLVVRVGSDDVDDPHQEAVDALCDFTAQFQGMGIIHTARKNIADELVIKKRRRLLEQQQSKNINIRQLSVADEARIKLQAESDAKTMNLNTVTLCFESFIQQSSGALVPLCEPVFSNPINNMKSALTGELKICRLDRLVSSCLGNDEVYMLVEKVGKKNIKVRFFELDSDDNEIWVAEGKFNELDVHHQFAIVLRTPPYRDQNITDTVDVFVELYRPSDGDRSEPIAFKYKPSDKTLCMGRKRARRSSETESLQPPPVLVDPMMCSVTEPDDTFPSGTSELNSLEKHHFNSAEFNDFLSNYNPTNDLTPLGELPPIMMFEDDNVCLDGPTLRDVLPARMQAIAQMKRNTKQVAQMSAKSAQPVFKVTQMSARVPTPVKPAQGMPFKVPTPVKSAQGMPAGLPAPMIPIPAHNAPAYPQGPSDNDKLLMKVTERLKELTVRGKASLNTVRDLFNERTDEGESALHLAVLNEDKEHVKVMIQALCGGQLADVLDTMNNRDENALHLAALTDQASVVTALLVGGANCALTNSEGDTALHLAVRHSHHRCLGALLEHAKIKSVLDSRNEQGWPALHMAVTYDNITALRDLVSAGCQVNATDKSGDRTVLHRAVEDNRLEMVRFLLARTGVEVNRQDRAGNTALHVAVAQRSKLAVQWLLEAKADPLIRNFSSSQGEADDLMKTEALSPIDLAGGNDELLDLILSRVSSQPPEQFEVKLEPEDILTDQGLFLDNATMSSVCHILDHNRGWRDLATLLELDNLVGSIGSSASPTKMLINYADIQGGLTVEKLRDCLTFLHQSEAVEKVDLMLARKLIDQS